MSSSHNDNRSGVSFIVPVYNERENIPRLIAAIDRFAQTHGALRFDAIFVDDGSADGSREALLASAPSAFDLRVIRLSRNFGKEVALSAGLLAASADAVVLMDADLQHPVALVERLVLAWLNEGFDVVYAERADLGREAWWKRLLRRSYYRVVNASSQIEIPNSGGDFQLLSRRAYEALRQLPEHERFMKGLYRWIGFKQKAIPYTPDERQAGKSKFSLIKLWALGLDGITSFSTLPLRLATWTGLFFAILSGGYGVWTIFEKLVIGIAVPGYPTLITAVVFIGAAQLIFLGIIGEYLGKVLMEVKHRPLFIVESDAAVPRTVRNPSARTALLDKSIP